MQPHAGRVGAGIYGGIRDFLDVETHGVTFRVRVLSHRHQREGVSVFEQHSAPVQLSSNRRPVNAEQLL